MNVHLQCTHLTQVRAAGSHHSCCYLILVGSTRGGCRSLASHRPASQLTSGSRAVTCYQPLSVATPLAANWKVCGAKACDGVPNKKSDGRCTMPPWKNRNGTDGPGYIDYEYANKDWSCATGQCEGRCATEDNTGSVNGECPTSSCIANGLGKQHSAHMKQPSAC
jgi:hypothetical protein